MEAMGPWDGARPAFDAGKAPRAPKPARRTSAKDGHAMALVTWKQLIDHGSMQDGEEHLRATARRAVARLSQTSYDAVFGMLDGEAGQEWRPEVTLTGDRGTVTLPVEVADLPDDVVWVPARSFGRGVLADLASPGSPVAVKSGVTKEVTR